MRPVKRFDGLLLLLPLVALVGGRGPSSTTEPAASATVAERIPEDWPYELIAPTPTAPQGMVASDAQHATRGGQRILERGGNAVDAVVATTFALAVVYPEAGNIGGGGFLVTRMNGTTAALDFREEAPSAAMRDMYLDENGESTDSSLVGHLASGVPGTVAGMRKAWERFGSMPWKALLQPAIELAAEDITVNERFAKTVQPRADVLGRFPASRKLFLRDGEPLQAGQTWENPDLAATLRRIAEQGRAGFYRGTTAQLIAQEMERGGGLLFRADLRRYEAKWRAPVAFDYRGHQVYGMPPPSSGGITMAIMGNILGAYNVGQLGWHTPRALHLQTEAMRRAVAARNHFLGDPDYTDIPRKRLLLDQCADRLRASVSKKATPSKNVSPETGRDSQPTMHTTHFSIVDDQGNAVALTATINFLYGSKVTVGDAGFVLNNEMNDFTAKPGEPNVYGLVQGDANAVAAGKRSLSSMSPTIVLGKTAHCFLLKAHAVGRGSLRPPSRSCRTHLTTGSTSVLVCAPRIHHQHLPDRVRYESAGLTPQLAQALRKRGHGLEEGGTVGNVPTILRTNVGRWAGMNDPRGSGSAAGY